MNGFGTYLLVDRVAGGVASRATVSAISARHARRVAVVLLLLALVASGLCGCAVSAPADEVIPDDSIPTPVAAPIVMTVAPNSYAEIVSWLGDSNGVTLDKVHQINHSEISLSLAAGTRATWVTGASATQFSFYPSPKITSSAIAKILGLTLNGLEIRADGSGTATVSGGIHRGFRWDGAPTGASVCSCGCGKDGCQCSTESSGPRSTSALPEVILYSRDRCSGCEVWERELAALKNKPFTVRIEKRPPAWVKVAPHLHWNNAAGEGRQQGWDNALPNGWHGAEAFVEAWQKSR